MGSQRIKWQVCGTRSSAYVMTALCGTWCFYETPESVNVCVSDFYLSLDFFLILGCLVLSQYERFWLVILCLYLPCLVVVSWRATRGEWIWGKKREEGSWEEWKGRETVVSMYFMREESILIKMNLFSVCFSSSYQDLWMNCLSHFISWQGVYALFICQLSFLPRFFPFMILYNLSSFSSSPLSWCWSFYDQDWQPIESM